MLITSLFLRPISTWAARVHTLGRESQHGWRTSSTIPFSTTSCSDPNYSQGWSFHYASETVLHTLGLHFGKHNVRTTNANRRQNVVPKCRRVRNFISYLLPFLSFLHIPLYICYLFGSSFQENCKNSSGQKGTPNDYEVKTHKMARTRLVQRPVPSAFYHLFFFFFFLSSCLSAITSPILLQGWCVRFYKVICVYVFLRPTVGWQSVDSRLTVGRQSANNRQWVGCVAFNQLGRLSER